MLRNTIFFAVAASVFAAAGCGGNKSEDATPLFTEAERKAIVAYWSAPERYTVEPTPDVSQTLAGRAWVAAARKKLSDGERATFDAWLEKRAAYDSWEAGGKKGDAPPAPGDPPSGAGMPPAGLHDLERVNITVPGSIWHKEYNGLVAERKAAAATKPGADDDLEAWEAWVVKQVARDKAEADGQQAPPDPGPMPESLKAEIGTPPDFFERMRPRRYTVTFAKEDAPAPFVYTDTVSFAGRADRYAYYRSENGVQRFGRRLADYEGDEKKRIDAIFAKAGRDPFERNVLQAVSRLEGGFEAVNTYDTGYVSIGFIQFITGEEGTGSLAAVLKLHKETEPEDFQKAFRRFGIDVAPGEGGLVVVDPAGGEELRGAAAVQKVIEDKRLTAVFERAGGLDGFRLAQVSVARSRYWPGEDPITVSITTVFEQPGGAKEPKTVGVYYGAAQESAKTKAAAARQAKQQQADKEFRSWAETKTLTAKVADVIKSEAGMATLMDRKVNRGNIRNIADAAAGVMREKKLTRIEDLAKYEKELVQAMKYRADFLSDKALSQPGAAAPQRVAEHAETAPAAPAAKKAR